MMMDEWDRKMLNCTSFDSPADAMNATQCNSTFHEADPAMVLDEKRGEWRMDLVVNNIACNFILTVFYILALTGWRGVLDL